MFGYECSSAAAVAFCGPNWPNFFRICAKVRVRYKPEIRGEELSGLAGSNLLDDGPWREAARRED